jgi:hypothetical protein
VPLEWEGGIFALMSTEDVGTMPGVEGVDESIREPNEAQAIP